MYIIDNNTIYHVCCWGVLVFHTIGGCSTEHNTPLTDIVQTVSGLVQCMVGDHRHNHITQPCISVIYRRNGNLVALILAILISTVVIFVVRVHPVFNYFVVVNFWSF